MDSTLKALLEIDGRAADVIAGITDAKQELSRENERKTGEFEAQIKEETEKKLNNQKKETERILTNEAETLKVSTDAKIQELKSYYETNGDILAGRIFKNITGREWEA